MLLDFKHLVSYASLFSKEDRILPSVSLTKLFYNFYIEIFDQLICNSPINWFISHF